MFTHPMQSFFDQIDRSQDNTLRLLAKDKEEERMCLVKMLDEANVVVDPAMSNEELKDIADELEAKRGK